MKFGMRWILILGLLFVANLGFARWVTREEVTCAATSLLTETLFRQTFPRASVASVEEMEGVWCVHLAPQGHLLFSGSTKLMPLLGYSRHDYTMPLAGHPAEVVEAGLRQQVKTAEAVDCLTSYTVRTSTQAVSETEARWETLLAPPSITLFASFYAKEVGPLLQTKWNQWAPWNDFTPQHTAEKSASMGSYQGRMPLGCVATMYSQIMKYHAWPTCVDQTFSKHLAVSGGALSSGHEVHFHRGTRFDWEQLEYTYPWKNAPESKRLPIARVGLFADILSSMTFGVFGSSAAVETASQNIWYEHGTHVRNGNSGVITASQLATIKDSLERQMPLPAAIPGHALVLDGYAEGYDGNTYLHLNYGWGGSEEDKYYLANSASLTEWVAYHAPKLQTHLNPLPATITNGHVMKWEVPAFHQNEIDQFTVTAIPYPMGSLTTWQDDAREIEDPNANQTVYHVTTEMVSGTSVPMFEVTKPVRDVEECYYFQEPFVPTATSSFTCLSAASYTLSLHLTVEIWSEGEGDWKTLYTVPKSDRSTGAWTPASISLSDYAGQVCKLRLNQQYRVQGGGYYPSAYFKLGQLQVTDVYALTQAAQTWQLGGAARQYTLNGLMLGKKHLIELTLLTKSGQHEMEITTTSVVATPSPQPAVSSVTNMSGASLVDNTLLCGALSGLSGLNVTCNEATTGLRVYSSNQTLMPNSAITVYERRAGDYLVLINSPQTASSLDGSRLILTLEAQNAEGDVALRDVVMSLRQDVASAEISKEVINSVTVNGQVTITGLLMPMDSTTLTIPARLNGCPVVAIGEGAFQKNTQLTSVSLPNMIQSIHASAFAGCTSLSSITIPDSVTTIAPDAFSECPLYTDDCGVRYESVAKKVLIEAPTLVYQAWSIPSSVRMILASAFDHYSYCHTDSQGVVYESEAKVVAIRTERRTAEVALPESVQFVLDSAFAGNESLTTLSLPTNLKFIGENAFKEVAPVTLTAPFLPQGMSTHRLETLTVAAGVTQIERAAFADCVSLKMVAIPASVKQIGDCAFKGCHQLEVVAFAGPPPSLVGKQAFPNTRGSYLPEFGDAWARVLNSTNQWYDLLMGTTHVTLTFDANGGDGGTQVTHPTGATFEAPTVTRLGYTFVRWVPAVPSVAPTQNTTYVAQWQQDIPEEEEGDEDEEDEPSVERVYTQTFDANGGEGGETREVVAGRLFDAPLVTREGYSFVEWLPKVPGVSPAENMTYVAQWRANQYQMTFNANGGTGGESVLMTYGVALSAPKVERPGYIFKGWYPAVPATVPAEPMTYTAQWQKQIDEDETPEMEVVDIKYLTYTIRGNRAMITGCRVEAVGHLIIPPRCEGFVVCEIASNAFKNQKRLEKVTFPDSLTKIGKDAFAGCSALRVDAVKLPTGFKSLGKGAFTGCKVAEIAAVPGETKTGTVAAGYKVATSASGFKLNGKAGTWTATFKKPGTYEVVLFKAGDTLKAQRFDVGAFPKVIIKMEGANAGCSVKGAGDYLMGKKVTLSAKASKEKIFIGFYDAQGKQLSSALKYTFVMGRENVTLTAKFKEEVINTGIEKLKSATWQVGRSYEITLPVTAESGVKSVKAKLPSGLKLAKTKAGQWQVTGSPKKAGAYTVSLTVGTVQKKQKREDFTMTVKPEETNLNLSAVQNATLNVNHGVSDLVIGASATSPIKSVKASKLPSGMKVQCINGTWQLIGTPKKAGSYNVKFTLVTKAGTKVEQTLTLTVNLVPAWAAKNFSGEVTLYEAGGVVESGEAMVSIGAMGDVSGWVNLDDGDTATIKKVFAKLLKSSENEVTLQLTVPWFTDAGKSAGKVKTTLTIQKSARGATLTYRDQAKGSYVEGSLNSQN